MPTKNPAAKTTLESSDGQSAEFPSTRYQGSKSKLVDWIWRNIADLDFSTCLDAFGGSGAVAYHLKKQGKSVTYNDLLKFNHSFGAALVENGNVRLDSEEVEWLLRSDESLDHPTFVTNEFQGIYFTDSENQWIDRTVWNIRRLEHPFKYDLAFFSLCQACLIKRPYNLFHRKNLYVRLADVKRSFGNKSTWDKPFEYWFKLFVEQANSAVFDNGRTNSSLNLDADMVPGEFDLVYIDTPYISSRGVPVDYLAFYHFLEGLANYDTWGKLIDLRSKHRAFKRQANKWTDKRAIFSAFDQLFKRYRDSILVVSYRSDGIPSESDLTALLRQYKKDVIVHRFGRYKYVLSTNSQSQEILLIGV
jgi:adenine-specific DNA-methyltransferase